MNGDGEIDGTHTGAREAGVPWNVCEKRPWDGGRRRRDGEAMGKIKEAK